MSSFCMTPWPEKYSTRAVSRVRMGLLIFVVHQADVEIREV